jgi:tRNA (guanine-N7-)-methyltransferase
MIKPENKTTTVTTDRRRLWGRAQGRPLSAHQAALVNTLLPRIATALPDPLNGLQGFDGIMLEIGFGGAEHLLHRAQENPKTAYIGVEPFLNGVGKALAGIEKLQLDNVRLHHGDVRNVLDGLPDACLEAAYILFPDPWPKPRHFKRRLIQEELISQLHRVLKPGGKLFFASDILTYVDWSFTRILRFSNPEGKGFDWPANSQADWMQPYEGWPGTRYEAKAFREGRTPHYFTFVKGTS